MAFIASVDYIKESGWQGHKDHSKKWTSDTKEDMFLDMLKKNNHIQKNFDKDDMNGDCWRFSDWNLQDEYDEWWYNLGEEKREEIFMRA